MNSMLKDKILLSMIGFEAGCPERAQHFLKVYQFAQIIADAEGMTGEAREILDIATLMHDIGIRPCEEKYGHCTGKMQEEEGTAHARAMLKAIAGYHVFKLNKNKADRICPLCFW